MEALVITLHVIVCMALIVLVLLQSGKEGMGVIFGGGSSSLFGSSGAGGILVKLTAWAAGLFLVTCVAYAMVTKVERKSESVILDTTAPAAPEAPIPVPTAEAPKSEAPADKSVAGVEKSAGQAGSQSVETTSPAAPAKDAAPVKEEKKQ